MPALFSFQRNQAYAWRIKKSELRKDRTTGAKPGADILDMPILAMRTPHIDRAVEEAIFEKGLLMLIPFYIFHR